MTYKAWKSWLLALPWSLRWFVLLVLFRPMLDVFYFLKHVSPLLSPLNIVGVMTPVLILGSLLSRTFPRKRSSSLDILFSAFGMILFLNVVAQYLGNPSFDNLTITMKVIMVLFLYIYVRRLIRSREDLRGLLTTFLYSCIFPYGMILYERLVRPLGDLVYTRGYNRYEGLYADVMSYAIYVIGGLLVAFYFYLDEENPEPVLKRAMRLGVMVTIAMVGLLSVHQTSSWGVAAAVSALFFYHGIQSRRLGLIVFLVIAGLAGGLLVGDTIYERLSTALTTDVAVLEGDKDMKYAFHGRMSRWIEHVESWEKIPAVAKLFGVSLSPRHLWWPGMLTGVHNDYLRLAFAAGLVGVLFYLAFYAAIFVKTMGLRTSDRFVVRAAMAVMLLYSVSTVPTLYHGLLYLTLSVFAYGVLSPQGRMASRAALRARRRGPGLSPQGALQSPLHPA